VPVLRTPLPDCGSGTCQVTGAALLFLSCLSSVSGSVRRQFNALFRVFLDAVDRAVDRVGPPSVPVLDGLPSSNHVSGFHFTMSASSASGTATIADLATL